MRASHGIDASGRGVAASRASLEALLLAAAVRRYPKPIDGAGAGQTLRTRVAAEAGRRWADEFRFACDWWFGLPHAARSRRWCLIEAAVESFCAHAACCCELVASELATPQAVCLSRRGAGRLYRVGTVVVQPLDSARALARARSELLGARALLACQVPGAHVDLQALVCARGRFFRVVAEAGARRGRVVLGLTRRGRELRDEDEEARTMATTVAECLRLRPHAVSGRGCSKARWPASEMEPSADSPSSDDDDMERAESGGDSDGDSDAAAASAEAWAPCNPRVRVRRSATDLRCVFSRLCHLLPRGTRPELLRELRAAIDTSRAALAARATRDAEPRVAANLDSSPALFGSLSRQFHGEGLGMRALGRVLSLMRSARARGVVLAAMAARALKALARSAEAAVSSHLGVAAAAPSDAVWGWLVAAAVDPAPAREAAEAARLLWEGGVLWTMVCDKFEAAASAASPGELAALRGSDVLRRQVELVFGVPSIAFDALSGADWCLAATLCRPRVIVKSLRNCSASSPASIDEHSGDWTLCRTLQAHLESDSSFFSGLDALPLRTWLLTVAERLVFDDAEPAPPRNAFALSETFRAAARLDAWNALVGLATWMHDNTSFVQEGRTILLRLARLAGAVGPTLVRALPAPSPRVPRWGAQLWASALVSLARGMSAVRMRNEAISCARAAVVHARALGSCAIAASYAAAVQLELCVALSERGLLDEAAQLALQPGMSEQAACRLGRGPLAALEVAGDACLLNSRFAAACEAYRSVASMRSDVLHDEHELLWAARFRLGIADASMGGVSSAAELQPRAYAMIRTATSGELAMLAGVMNAKWLIAAGMPLAALHAVDRVRGACDTWPLPMLHWTRAQVHALRGDAPEAGRALRAAAEALKRAFGGDGAHSLVADLRARACQIDAKHGEQDSQRRTFMRASIEGPLPSTALRSEPCALLPRCDRPPDLWLLLPPSVPLADEKELRAWAATLVGHGEQLAGAVSEFCAQRGVDQARAEYVQAVSVAAQVLWQAGDMSGALLFARTVHERLRQALSARHINVIRAQVVLATALHLAGENEEAWSQAATAVALLDRLFLQSPEAEGALLLGGRVGLVLGETRVVLKMAERYAAQQVSKHPPDHLRVGVARVMAGCALEADRRYVEAAAFVAAGLQFLSAPAAAGGSEALGLLASALELHTRVLIALGRFDEALLAAQRGAQADEAAFGAGSALAAAARGRVGSVLLLLRRPAEAVAEFRATLATRVIEAKPDSTLAVLLRIGLADALREIEREKDTLPAVSAERGALEDALRSATMTPLSSIKVFEDARVRLVALEALLRLYNRASLFAEAVQRVWFHCGVELEAPDSLEFVHVLEELAHALAGLKLRAESAHTLRRAVHVMLAAGIDDADRQAALIERACDLLCELGLKDEALELALRLWPTPENQARNRAALKSNVLQPPQPEESVARADPTTARRAYYKARASLALPPQLQSRPPKPPKRQPQPLPPPPPPQQQQQQLLLATAADD